MTPFESAPSETLHVESVELLERALDRLRAGETAGARELVVECLRSINRSKERSVLVFVRDTSTFRLGAATVSLARKGSMKRVLMALVDAHAEHRVLSAHDLVDAGWPRERPKDAAAGLLRVYTVVRRLRAAGLHDVLLTVDDGYCLDPGVAVITA